MRISWFTENYPPNKGGMSRSCDRIIANLRKHHTIHIYHFTNKQQAFFSEAHVGGSYTAVPVYEDSEHTLNVLWAFLKDNQNIGKSNCFVSFGSHLCLKGIPLMATWLEKPLLTCIRGNDFDTAIFSQKKQNLLYALENSAAIACVSKEKCDRIKKMTGKNNIFFTPNSIDAESWEVLESDRLLAQNIRQQLPASKLIIGLVGYLKPKKGIEFFLDNLQKSICSKDVQIRIIGEIDTENSGTIEMSLKNSGLPYSICQPLSQTELIANYLVCDAIAIPSIYDGMPNVIFEAGILEIPIIASKAGGIPDILSNNEAYLFDTLSEISLLKELSNFKNDSNVCKIEKTKLLKLKLQTEMNLEYETKNYLQIFDYIINNQN